MSKTKQVFLSYAHEDLEFARRLYDGLVKRGGKGMVRQGEKERPLPAGQAKVHLQYPPGQPLEPLFPRRRCRGRSLIQQYFAGS